jgi:hypothetical protein
MMTDMQKMYESAALLSDLIFEFTMYCGRLCVLLMCWQSSFDLFAVSAFSVQMRFPPFSVGYLLYHFLYIIDSSFEYSTHTL